MAVGDSSAPVARNQGTKRQREKAFEPPEAQEEAESAPSSRGRALRSTGGIVGRRMRRILYLFAGVKRKSVLAGCLKRSCSGTGVKVHVLEIDILQGGRRHNMLLKARQRRILAAVRRGGVRHDRSLPAMRNFLASVRGKLLRAQAGPEQGPPARIAMAC